MKTDSHIGFACTEEFAELCALATTAALTLEECARLEKHVQYCDKCKKLLADYRALTSEGMAKLGATLNANTIPTELEASWRHAEARSELLDKLRAEPADTVGDEDEDATPAILPALRPSLLQALGIAAVLILGLVVGYRFGDRPSGRVAPSAIQNSVEQLHAVEGQRDALNAELAQNAKTIGDLANRARQGEGELAELKLQKAALETRAQLMSAATQAQTDSFTSQRETLEHRLRETEQTLRNVKEDLNAIEDERRKGQLRTASLETTIDELSMKLRERDETVKRDEEFLASDRDVRELMGARQLYIADVFDVDQNGKKRSSFGRVFYTKGKSLIFYAFDLDLQPAYRDAKARASKTFQVWGSAGQDNAKPFGLGVFYMDSESNRRWVFKSDDPNVLAQVNAVFVTVESKQGSKAPSGKPFLYAYLRAAPANHP